MAPVEFIAAVLQPVRPWDQHLTSPRRAHLVGPVSVDKLPAARGVCAQSSAHRDNHRPLISGYDLDLLAGWRDHRPPQVTSATRPGPRRGTRSREGAR